MAATNQSSITTTTAGEVATTLRFTRPLWDRVSYAAIDLSTTKNQFVNEAIEEKLHRHEQSKKKVKA